MKERILWVALFTFICIFGFSTLLEKGKTAEKFQKWEYKYAAVNIVKINKTDGELSKLGREGWELVTYSHQSDGSVGIWCVMKRRVD